MKELPYKKLEGLSDKLLRDHFELYRRYRARLEAVEKRLGRADSALFGPLSVEAAFLRNAILLHELYFEQLKPGGAGDPSMVFADQPPVIEDMNRLALPATGWVVFGYNRITYETEIFPMSTHGEGYIAGVVPIIVLDCYEHAYMPQYGLDKEAYLEAFWKNVDWTVAGKRLMKATVQEPFFGPDHADPIIKALVEVVHAWGLKTAKEAIEAITNAGIHHHLLDLAYPESNSWSDAEYGAALDEFQADLEHAIEKAFEKASA